MDIILPELGEGISKATVVCWHVKVGDMVHFEDEICEVATDKAIFNVEAPANGRLKSMIIPPGQEVMVGGLLGTVE